MTRTQGQILESIAALPEDERRSLVKYLIEANMDKPSFVSSMTPEQRQRLQEGIEQAESGEYSPAAEVFERLKQRLQTP